MITTPLPLVKWERDKDDPLYWQMWRENDDFLRRQYWWWRHYLDGTLKNSRQLEAQRLSREAEIWVAGRIRTLGYQVSTTTHKCPFDLWVQDEAGRAARVEVKISLYHPLKKGGGRYQADVRHDQADVLVFVARNGRDWPFVIPMAAIAPRRNIALWTLCPADYSGQWAPYLEAWEHLTAAVAAAGQATHQLPLWSSQE